MVEGVQGIVPRVNRVNTMTFEATLNRSLTPGYPSLLRLEEGDGKHDHFRT